MKTKEAIERVRSRFDKWALDEEDLTAPQTLGLIDADNEDEKIRKQLIDEVKEQINNIPASDCCNSDDLKRLTILESWLAYLEKQKDSGKAIAAIEKIDKYIDSHTANAHDMDDSNPDKKYYSGVDDTLSNIAGILNSAYSEEKPKEQKDYNKPYEEVAKSEWFKKAYEGKSLGCDYEQKEQKPSTEETELNSIAVLEQMGYACVPPGAKPAEWSEEDEAFLDSIEEAISSYYDLNHAPQYHYWLENKLKSLHPQPREDTKCEPEEGDIVVNKDGVIAIFESWGHHPDGGSFNDHSYFFAKCTLDGDCYNEVDCHPDSWGIRYATPEEIRKLLPYLLVSYRPHWKPSEYTLSLVKKVADGEMLTGVEQMAMGMVYEQLKSLYK